MVSGTTSGLVGTKCLKLKLGALQFMPGIKNLNLNFFLILNEKNLIKKYKKISNFKFFFLIFKLIFIN
jgi:hypothetical protein